MIGFRKNKKQFSVKKISSLLVILLVAIAGVWYLLAVKAAPGVCDANGLCTVQAYWNGTPGSQDFFLAGNGNETLGAPWEDRGVIFKAYNHPIEGTTVVRRFYNESVNQHFWTLDDNEAAAALAFGAREENHAFYAARTQIKDTVPVFRLSNSSVHSYYYTTDPGYRDQLLQSGFGWTDGNPVFYVYMPGYTPKPANIPCEEQVLSEGDSGECVKALQSKLNLLNAQLPVDGEFTSAVKGKLLTLQAFWKFSRQDGSADSTTWADIEKVKDLAVEKKAYTPPPKPKAEEPPAQPTQPQQPAQPTQPQQPAQPTQPQQPTQPTQPQQPTQPEVPTPCLRPGPGQTDTLAQSEECARRNKAYYDYISKTTTTDNPITQPVVPPVIQAPIKEEVPTPTTPSTTTTQPTVAPTPPPAPNQITKSQNSGTPATASAPLTGMQFLAIVGINQNQGNQAKIDEIMNKLTPEERPAVENLYNFSLAVQAQQKKEAEEAKRLADQKKQQEAEIFKQAAKIWIDAVAAEELRISDTKNKAMESLSKQGEIYGPPAPVVTSTMTVVTVEFASKIGTKYNCNIPTTFAYGKPKFEIESLYTVCRATKNFSDMKINFSDSELAVLRDAAVRKINNIFAEKIQQ